MTDSWIRPLYEDRRIYNKAGRTFVEFDADLDEIGRALTVIGNWRAAHRYPLHSITMGLRQRAHSVDRKAIVVQRLKRLPSIVPKLERGLNLTQIQDIGGCRAVLSNLDDLLRLNARYFDKSMDWMEGKSYLNGPPNDYIREPKSDGYRSVHYVLRYMSDHEKYKCFDEMKIEVQVRTGLQHCWATAVEIVDFFTGERLKTDIDKNEATPKWKRFFKLMGTVIARIESCEPVPGTPSSQEELIEELRYVCDSFHVINKLEGYGTTVKRIEDTKELPKRGGAYVVILNVNKRTLRILPYNEQTDNYLKKEQEYKANPHIQVLQADAASLSQLKRAYPNYDLDTKQFVDIVKNALGWKEQNRETEKLNGTK